MIDLVAAAAAAVLHNDAAVQLIRSTVQAIWAAVFGLALVADALTAAGLTADQAAAVAVPLTMAAIVAAGRQLPRLHPFFGYLINGVHRPPAYTVPPPE